MALGVQLDGMPYGTTGGMTVGVTGHAVLVVVVDCLPWSSCRANALLSVTAATAVTSKALVASRLPLAGIPSLPMVAR